MERPLHHLATRRSPLALRQAELTRDVLMNALPDADWELLAMTTTGDERLKWSLEEKGGKGLFTKELETALLEERALLAIHSAKDLPTTLPEGLTIAGYLPRADPRDVLITRKAIEHPALIATSSPRRRAQLAERFPDAEWTTIRGNVQTRLRKISTGEADATLLAAAGLERLGITEGDFPELHFEHLAVDAMVPAPGQAAIAVQSRNKHASQFTAVFCADTAHAVTIEKAFLASLGGGCQTPVGAHWENDVLHIFHPNIGYQNTPFKLHPETTPTEALQPILHQWGLIK